jgi:hypothetical protein
VTKGSNKITGRAIAMDGALTKNPQIQPSGAKVNSGIVPKVPITTGSKKK